MTKRTIVIQWPDGRVQQARTWSRLLYAMHRLAFNRQFTRQQFREELAQRAFVWSGAKVETDVPDEFLLRQLAAAGLFKILIDNDPAIEYKVVK